MTNEELDKLFAHYPDMIIHSVTMSEPNECIVIHNGIFMLKIEDQYIEIEGEVYFAWFPSSGTKFKGVVKSASEKYYKILQGFATFQLYIDNENIGNCLLSTFTASSLLNDFVEGSMVSTTVIGDKTISVSKIKFKLPNFIDLQGAPIKHRDAKGLKNSKARIIFNDADYTITLDKLVNYDDLSKKLESKGGYMCLYNGEITKNKGSISFDDLQELTYSFSTFLSFLNGKRSSILFLQGIYDDEVIWTDYSDRFVDQYQFTVTWPNKMATGSLNNLWQNFSLLWKEPKHKDFLVTAIHWYIEANNQSGFSEGAIIMAQTALELIYNWLIIETKKLLLGKDAESISAANKIRLLLSNLNVDPQIPDGFSMLKGYSDFIDGPDAIVQIRNALVHGQEEKRKKLTSIDNKIKYQVLNLAIWYIELSLLYILKHEGIYLNRSVASAFINGKTQNVPWARPIAKKEATTPTDPQ